LVNWDQDLVTDIDEPNTFGNFCPLPSAFCPLPSVWEPPSFTHH